MKLINSIALFCCCLIVGLPLLVGHPGGKAGKYMAKASKKSMRLGLDRVQQRKQQAWELILAKKASAQNPHEHHVVAPVYDPILAQASVPSAGRERPSQTSSRLRFSMPSGRPVTVAWVFSLFLMAQLASSQTWCDLCHAEQNHINRNMPVFDSARSAAQEIAALDGRGPITFPATLEMNCPPWPCSFHWQVDHANEWYRKGKDFLEAMQQKIDEVNQRIRDFNAHTDQERDSYCAKIANFISSHKEYYDKLREVADKYKDQIGTVIFPSHLELLCPSMLQIGVDFLKRLEQKHDELDWRIQEYNKLITQEDSAVVAQCAGLVQDIDINRDVFVRWRQGVAEHPEVLGTIVIPETPAIICDSTRPSAAYITAAYFLKEMDQAIADARALIEKHNKRVNERQTGL